MSKKNKTMLDQVEEIKDNDLMNNLKSNEQLKKALIKARNLSRSLRDDIVPMLAKAVHDVMTEMLQNKTEIADKIAPFQPNIYCSLKSKPLLEVWLKEMVTKIIWTKPINY
mgnify:CR=1 FL=1